ncbi:hypothetical protein Q0590_06465 [Rhodocytophaga aerolata]|uniref:Tetratricopeptide repeat protein n=1 Tax=Rhodocytophaga aerolata TaxID=455078 RepID=A0ABT8R2L5_9BACT|nr:hypothetical protein [Rhodocytophaga aerolata]MDO1445886.1 hypothetical protein [Rhodocytophaga aerolata]
MKIITLLLVVYTSLCQAVFAQSTTSPQEYVFKVLASSGSNSVARGSAATDWKSLKTGQKITKEDKIKLAPDSFLGLVHKSGRTLELKTPGTFSASELATKLATSQATFNQKYVDFMINEITKAEKEDVNKNRHSNMGIEGKVERGEYEIVARMPAAKPTHTFSDQVLLKWNKLPGTRSYKINVLDMFDEVLYSATTADTMFTLDLSQATLRKESSYLVAISSIDRPSATFEKYSIAKVSPEDALTINKKLAQLKEGKEETSVSKLLQASFFEENNLLLDAMKAYEEAIKLQPSVEDYKTAYQQFLDRNNFQK